MTYSMQIGRYKLIFSDTHFKDFRKKPTISVYDADNNTETKIASFNSQETFEWFVKEIAEHAKLHRSILTAKQLIEECEVESPCDVCGYRPKHEPQKMTITENDARIVDRWERKMTEREGE